MESLIAFKPYHGDSAVGMYCTSRYRQLQLVTESDQLATPHISRSADDLLLRCGGRETCHGQSRKSHPSLNLACSKSLVAPGVERGKLQMWSLI